MGPREQFKFDVSMIAARQNQLHMLGLDSGMSIHERDDISRYPQWEADWSAINEQLEVGKDFPRVTAWVAAPLSLPAAESTPVDTQLTRIARSLGAQASIHFGLDLINIDAHKATSKDELTESVLLRLQRFRRDNTNGYVVVTQHQAISDASQERLESILSAARKFKFPTIVLTPHVMHVNPAATPELSLL